MVYQAVPGTAHRVWPIAHLSEGDLDNLFYQQDNLLYTNRIDISHSGH